MLRDEWEVSRAGGASKPERTRVHVRCAGSRDLSNQVVEVGRTIRNPGEHGHHVDADIDSGGAESSYCTNSGVGRRGSGLDESCKLATHGDERQVDRERRARRDTLQDIHITSNERTLGDDDDREPLVRSKRLEHTARDAESTLGRLIGIGCRTYDDDFAAGQRLETWTPSAQLVAENGGRVVLYQHVPLEREPWRHPFDLGAEVVARGGAR